MHLNHWNLYKVPLKGNGLRMAQVTIYLADDVAAEARKQARRADKPLSTFLAEIIEAHTKPATWPQAFVTLLTTVAPGA
jgi:hypothetical protein